MIDTHAHLYDPQFSTEIDKHILEIKDSGVSEVWLPNCDVESWNQLESLFQAYPDFVLPMIGLHPTYVKEGYIKELQQLKSILDDRKVLAIGEIGLDYFVEGLDPQRQEFFFHKQLDLAQQFQLPVILHVRRSQDAILKALRRRKVPSGIAHAFNGSHQQAEQFIELGFKLGFGGAATYDRALQIRRLLQELPLESIVTETDAPDIPPAWLKEEGGQFNEPALLPRIAQQLAGIRGISEEVFSKAVWQNAMQALPRWSSLMTNNPNSQSAS